jgi:hypothetical protein
VLLGGFILLAINIALPLIFRHLNDSKIGTKPTDGQAYEMDYYSWLILLPAMFALIHLVPRPRETGELLPQRRWLPMALFALWLAASAVHLRCLTWVFNFDWEFIFAVPLLWVVAWSAWLRQTDFIAKPMPALSQALLLLPLPTALLAFPAATNKVFLALTALNAGAYAILALGKLRNRLAFHLMFGSLIAVGAGCLRLPIHSHHGLPLAFSPEKWLALGVAFYLMFWIIRSRNPKLAVLGAVILEFGTLFAVHDADLSLPLAIQFAFVFVLTHSLLWEDAKHPGASHARTFAGICWLVHTLYISFSSTPEIVAMIYGCGAFVLFASIFARVFLGVWKPVILPLAASLVLLCQPGEFVADRLRSTSAGVLAVAGSLALFGLGTLAALTKHRWNRPQAEAASLNQNNHNRLIP